MDCYVYYRVMPADATGTRRCVDTLFASVNRALAVTPRLQVRCDGGGATPQAFQTWMEIYPGVSAGFADTLQQLSRDAGLDGLIEGGRHIECFDDAPCA